MKINEIKAKAISMGDRVYEMLEFIEKGFMENKPEHLTLAIRIENELNDSEKSLTGSILELSKTAKDTKNFLVLEQMVETFERMGDEASNLIERIEIKIAEHLLFSDLGVEQFNETYNAMKKSIEMLREFLKDRGPGLKDRIIDNGYQVKNLVERYRKEHAERLVKGICTPMAANMYFDMLDFTGNLARHASNVAKLF